MNRRAMLLSVIGGGFASSASAREMTTRPEPRFQNLGQVGPDRQVVAIIYNGGAYRVTTADGQSANFLEANLRFKVDSSDIGPLSGKPVILPGGMIGDRASVFFASLAEMSALFNAQG